MLPSGHELLGKRVARYFDSPTPTLGSLTKWLCAAPGVRAVRWAGVLGLWAGCLGLCAGCLGLYSARGG